MIKLTSHVNKQTIYVSHNAISAVYSVLDGTVTCVACYDNNWFVTETPDQILALIPSS